jgi:hypothetical protein
VNRQYPKEEIVDNKNIKVFNFANNLKNTNHNNGLQFSPNNKVNNRMCAGE